MQLTPEGRTFYGYVAAGCAQFFKGENDLSNLISLENGTILYQRYGDGTSLLSFSGNGRIQQPVSECEV